MKSIIYDACDSHDEAYNCHRDWQVSGFMILFLFHVIHEVLNLMCLLGYHIEGLKAELTMCQKGLDENGHSQFWL